MELRPGYVTKNAALQRAQYGVEYKNFTASRRMKTSVLIVWLGPVGGGWVDGLGEWVDRAMGMWVG